jgi:hypothetical protein
MRSIIVRTVIATVALTLASATLVQAAPHRQKTRDPLLRLAVDVESSARHLYKQADRQTFRRPDPSERRALKRLADLSYQSRVFRRMLANDGPYSFRVEREFRELEQSLRAVQRSFPALCPDRRLRGDFRETRRLIDRLDYGLESRLARFQGRRGHGKPRHGGPDSASVRLDKRFKDGHASVSFNWND